MEIMVAGFRWDVELVPAIDVKAGQVVSLAGRWVRDVLTGFRPADDVDWENEYSRTVLTREPHVGESLVQFGDAYRMFVARPAWPLLVWTLKG